MTKDEYDKKHDELKIYMETYKDHFSLFIKGMMIYFAILGALTGYIYREGMNQESKYAVSLFIISISVIVMFGCFLSLKWLASIKSLVDEITKAIDYSNFPFFGAKMVGVLSMVAAILFLIGGIISIYAIKMKIL